jgi:hypothetical protein
LSFLNNENQYPIIGFFLTLVVGVTIGIIAAQLYIVSERSGRVLPNLSPLVALMFGIMAIVLGEMIYLDAGLFAAVAMGLTLANQRVTPAIGFRTFTETIEPLIIGILFIMLAALVNISELVEYLVPALGLVAIYVLVARPLVGFAATRGLGFGRSQRVFIGALAPRGIVVAATSSLFAISLTSVGVNFPQLVPVVFTVIIGTVAIYGFSVPLLSRKLNLSQPGRTAVALTGGQSWVVDLAAALSQAGVRVMLIEPGEGNFQRLAAGKLPYIVYTGSFAELSDDEVVDEAHEFKNQVKWLIIATSDPDRIKIAEETFLPAIGHTSIIIFGRSRARQEEAVFSGKRTDILANTPFGLFGRNEDELLDMLDSGGCFEVLERTEQPPEGGVPEGTKAFLRVCSDGTLAVPGSVDRLTEGESLIVVTR